MRTWRIEERNDAREAEREKLVAEREGRLLPPDLALYLWPNHRCRAENNDVRDILQTTIVWHEYFVDLTSGRAGTANSWPHSSPSASAERLKPREAFEAEYTHKGRLGELVCESTHDCLLILECEVRFHRAADFARYFKHDYAFIETGDRFTTISELRNAASDEHGRPQLQWLKGKERYQRAFSALLEAERQYGFHRHEVDAWSAEADGLLDPFRNGLQKGTHP